MIGGRWWSISGETPRGGEKMNHVFIFIFAVSPILDSRLLGKWREKILLTKLNALQKKKKLKRAPDGRPSCW